MKFKDYKEKKIAAEEVDSHAECLAAMDCLMHHMNDEDEIDGWLQVGVPDNDHWDVLNLKRIMLDDKAGFYTGLVRNMTYGDYETCVMVFADAVKRQCFDTEYAPRAFT